MSLRYLERLTAREPVGALFFMHGRGGLEADVFPFVDGLDPKRRLHGYSPRGPWPWGNGRAAWDDPAASAADRDRAAAEVVAWFDSLPFPAERLVLAGWSQGAAVAYALGLAAERPRAAGVLAFRRLPAGGGMVPPERAVATGSGAAAAAAREGPARADPVRLGRCGGLLPRDSDGPLDRTRRDTRCGDVPSTGDPRLASSRLV